MTTGDVPAPCLTQAVSDAAEVLQAADPEARLAELGLAGHTPVGVIQNLLEFMHMDLGMPWWAAIVVGKQPQHREKQLVNHIFQNTLVGSRQVQLEI